ncbi:MAG TPA: outer membrane beta-barrel family protein [Chitinophagaceae bacterium]|nr:outer membrane beta-barrel family protein [Chitinophagaceae bacterium]
MIRIPVFLYFLLLYTISATAQEDREPTPRMDMPVLQLNENKIYGKILNNRTGKAIEAVSVQLVTVTRDSAGGSGNDSVIAGMFTRANGDFSFGIRSSFDSLYLLISAIGYEALKMSIPVPGRDNKREQNRERGFEKDLGNIMLEPAIQQLGEVTVTSQRRGLVMGIDRKIFNVEKSLVASGGTGLDVMKNIPSVSVDVEGNVLLRNSEPQIFVDGRPTILTLDQIPADNIERVELITNPSAKFDAASGGGIINIVLKKNKKMGLNGLFSAGTGSPDIWNGTINLNIRQGKFNLFAIGSFNQTGGKARSQTVRTNKSNGMVEDYFNQSSQGERMRRFGSVRAGVDYFMDNRNTFSITQNLLRGKSTNREEQEQQTLDISQDLLYSGQRFSSNENIFDRYNTQLNYTHKFPQPGKELTANINYNWGKGKEAASILNNYYNPDGTSYDDPDRVSNRGSNNSDQWTFQLDFIAPRGEDHKLETGLRTFINDYHSIFDAFALANGTETKLPISNNYQYRELTNAVYFTYSNQWESWTYQLGLRAEHSKFDGELVDSARKFGYEYPDKLGRIWDALFPSLFLTKQFGEETEVQINYSRRIRRPNFWNLNPFVDISDPVNLRQGNPQLRPEFVNSFELNYSQGYGRDNNFLGVVYFRNNPGDITRYSDTISSSQYQQLNNAAVDPNAILNTFINAQATNRMGLELTLQHKWSERFEITPTIDMQYRKVKATVRNLNLSNEGFSWESKLILNYKTVMEKNSLFRNFSIQAIGEYESAEIQAQGKSRPEYSLDLAFRKDFLRDKKANLTFSISDVFNSLRFGNIYDTENFYQDSYWRRNVRTFRLVFSYRFGDADFTFRRSRDNGGDEGD